MSFVYPVKSKEMKNNEKDSYHKSSILAEKLNGFQGSSTVQKKDKNTNKSEKMMSNSADEVLNEKKKRQKRDRAKRPQTITNAKSEAEHVFDAFCNKGKSLSAPSSFSARIDRNISGDKMNKLKQVMKKSSDSEIETETHLEERRKKSVFKWLQERIRALNRKEPLHKRSARVRQREEERKEIEDKSKLSRLFNSFRVKKRPKNGETESSSTSTVGKNLKLGTVHSTRGKGRLFNSTHHKKPQAENMEMPPSPSSYPFSPSGMDRGVFFFDGTIENDNIENGNIENVIIQGGTDGPGHLDNKQSINLPRFFSEQHLKDKNRRSSTGSSVDRLEPFIGDLNDIRYIDDESQENIAAIPAAETLDGDLVVANGVRGGAGTGMDAIDGSSVDSKDDYISYESDSGVDGVMDKYIQAAKILDKIGKRVDKEIHERSQQSTSTLAKKLSSELSYQKFQQQLDQVLKQADEPLLKQVALVFLLSRSAIDMAGINSQTASRIKNFALQYYNSHFAPQVASEGGLESLTEDSDTQ